MIEFERRYLAKKLPNDLLNFASKEIIDLYIPASFSHPCIRIRKVGDSYEITKKAPSADDQIHMLEQTIQLNRDEFIVLQTIPSKTLSKKRYYYKHNSQDVQIDIYQDNLQGLVICDFEFTTKDEYDRFIMPHDLCLSEILPGDRNFLAGGMLAGKKYSELEKVLKEKYNYLKLG